MWNLQGIIIYEHEYKGDFEICISLPLRQIITDLSGSCLALWNFAIMWFIEDISLTNTILFQFVKPSYKKRYLPDDCVSMKLRVIIYIYIYIYIYELYNMMYSALTLLTFLCQCSNLFQWFPVFCSICWTSYERFMSCTSCGRLIYVQFSLSPFKVSFQIKTFSLFFVSGFVLMNRR